MLKDYINLTKPGIVRGNSLTAFAGFMLASNGSIDLGILVGSIAGLSLVIASACVFNNVIDREIDSKMDRTKKRAIVTGDVSKSSALIYGYILLIVGISLILLLTNLLTLAVSLIGFLVYVFVYGYFKRRSLYSTEIGSISGAVPPVVGYVAVSNSIDIAAYLLFAFLVLWQMPHFYAVGIKRVKDYKNANLPIVSVKKGIKYTKLRAQFYLILLLLATPLLTITGYTGWTYLIVMTFSVAFWLAGSIVDLNKFNDKQWASRMFGVSLVVLSLFSFLLVFNAWLP